MAALGFVMVRRLFRLTLVFFLCVLVPAWAQEDDAPTNERPKAADEQLVEEADQIYRFGAKRQALDQYQLALNINPNNIRANYMTGVCYLQTINRELSLKYLLKAYDLNPNYISDLVRDNNLYPDLLFLIGFSYHLNENFDRAVEYYDRFKKDLQFNKVSSQVLEDKDRAIVYVDRKIYECSVGRDMIRQPKKLKVTPLNSINSPFPDYAPTIDAKGTTLIFTSRRAGGISPDVANDLYFYEDIWQSKKSGETWGEPQLIKELCDAKSESNLSLSPDGKTLLVYKDINNGDIYESKLEGGKWSKAKPLAGNVNSEGAEGSALISPDGKYLFFSSDRPGGFGGLDIYVSEKLSGDKWGTPSNMGPNINSEFDDDAPMLRLNGKTLFFASKGHRGMGGFDIFRSDYDTIRKEWGPCYNVGYPVNSTDNDIYFVQGEDTLKAYFTSIKESGVGDADIFLLEFLSQDEQKKDSVAKQQAIAAADSTKDQPELTDAKLNTLADAKIGSADSTDSDADGKGKKGRKGKGTGDEDEDGLAGKGVTLVISVVDKSTGALMDADLQFTNKNSKAVLTPEPDKLGTYRITFPKGKGGVTNYTLAVQKEGFVFKNISLSIPNSKTMTLNRRIELDPITVNKAVRLRNIYFDFNKWNIKPESNRELNVLVNFMKKNPTVIIEVGGHTDNVGGDAFNQRLSQRRADAVVGYLTKRGIPGSRLRSVGYGRSKPLASNDDETEGRELNRRTEFVVLGKRRQ